MDDLEENNTTLKDEVAVLKGLMQVSEHHIQDLSKKVVDLTARSMANNIVISGILGDQEGETGCKEKVLDLMSKHMKMTVNSDEVVVAHHAKGKMGIKPRNMIVRCKPELCDRVFQFMKNLKEVVNASGDPYYISKQLPEPLFTEKKECDQRITESKKSNAQLPEDQKHKKISIQVKNNTLFFHRKNTYLHLHYGICLMLMQRPGRKWRCYHLLTQSVLKRRVVAFVDTQLRLRTPQMLN